MRYTYLPLLEQELQELKLDYNSHKIRKQRGKLRPDGIPDDMFFFPERFGEQESFGFHFKKSDKNIEAGTIE